jgi:hypothetical protein
MCDGTKTVAELVELFSAHPGTVENVTPEKVCLFGIELLRQQGFIAA